MTAVLDKAADAIVALINEHDWGDGYDFEAAVRFLWKVELKDLTGFYVTVRPATETRERIARGARKKEYTLEIDVGVQTKANGYDRATCSPALSLCEMIADFFDDEDRHFEGEGFEAQCIGAGKLALWDEEQLEKDGVITCVARLTVLARLT